MIRASYMITFVVPQGVSSSVLGLVMRALPVNRHNVELEKGIERAKLDHPYGYTFATSNLRIGAQKPRQICLNYPTGCYPFAYEDSCLTEIVSERYCRPRNICAQKVGFFGSSSGILNTAPTGPGTL